MESGNDQSFEQFADDFRMLAEAYIMSSRMKGGTTEETNQAYKAMVEFVADTLVKSDREQQVVVIKQAQDVLMTGPVHLTMNHASYATFLENVTVKILELTQKPSA